MSKKPVHETEKANELSQAIRVALPPMEKGIWSDYHLETQNFDLRIYWDKDCQDILIRAKVTP